VNGGDPLTAPGVTLRIGLKRVYDPAYPEDGSRVLVDRVWPRGIRREALAAELWLRDAAPSTELRRWFNHDPERWVEFQRRYWAELDDRPETVRQLLALAAARGLTLLYSARDREHNQAAALRDYLLSRTPPSKGEDHGSD
jgi:uncharacterized protein YeaO (DUF488 family)